MIRPRRSKSEAKPVYVSKKPIVLLSIQRSGTNFLRRVLGSHPAIDPLFGEIFDPNFIKQPLSFFNFYQRAVVGDPSLCLPDQRIVAFENYIECLDRKVEAEHYILDIKYNSIRQMESYWPRAKEVLTQYIIDQQWPVIHLIRTDLLAAIVSQMRARETGVWMTKGNNHCDSYSTTVDPVGIVNTLVGRRQAIEKYRRDFTGARLLELIYEEFIEAPNGINELSVERMRNFLNVTDKFSRVPETKKLITQPMSEVIENYENVVATAAARKVALTISL
jgi:hypothetical protein